MPYRHLGYLCTILAYLDWMRRVPSVLNHARQLRVEIPSILSDRDDDQPVSLIEWPCVHGHDSMYTPPAHDHSSPFARQLDALYAELLDKLCRLHTFDNGYTGWGGCTAFPAPAHYLRHIQAGSSTALTTLRLTMSLDEVFFYEAVSSLEALEELTIQAVWSNNLDALAGLPPLSFPHLRYFSVKAPGLCSPLQLA
ncbi:hypothetical protein M422DRAFT_240683 [Sphaerobolus stellatus SS14]|nr:hypothetical protein M422DRAFT_240683 [Sphaerobolus stellatus SS14]